MNAYLAIDSHGSLYTNSVCELIALWLKSSQGSIGGVLINMSARE